MRRLLVVLILVVVAGAALRWIRPVQPSPSVIAAAQQRLDDGVWRAVVLGDSVARGAGDERSVGIAGYLAAELRGSSADPIVPINLGMNGARTANVAATLNRPSVREHVKSADLIVVSLGGNDLYGDPRAQILSRLLPTLQRKRTSIKVARVIDTIQRVNPAARIYVLGLYNPYRSSALATWLTTQVNLWDGTLIQRLASRRRVTVLRIADLLGREERISPLDHFHPGSDGYRAIARRIAETL